jgi:hypothetical protein
MGRAMDRRLIEVIPLYIKRHFQKNDIPKVFDLLERHFRTSGSWRNEFKIVLDRSERSQDTREVFAKFLVDNFDPSLKHLQKRGSVIMSVLY